MDSTASSLAVMARAMHWRLDEAAFELGGGRSTQQQRDSLAADLIGLAEVLRSDQEPLVIDAADR